MRDFFVILQPILIQIKAEKGELLSDENKKTSETVHGGLSSWYVIAHPFRWMKRLVS